MCQVFQQEDINYKFNILSITDSCKEGNKHKITLKKCECIDQLVTINELQNMMHDGAN